MANPLAGDVKIPGIGEVPKKYVAAVGGVLVVFVGWRYYVASGSDGEEATDTGYEDGGTIPSLDGPAFTTPLPRDDDDQDDGPTGDEYGFTGKTNSQWTQYAASQLQQGDRWSYNDILEALGSYLAGRPLTTTQQSIVQAAIAVAGQPPVGYHTVIPGGNTDIIVAPSGVRVSATTETTATVTFSPVAGAAYYRVYRSGAATNVTSGAGTSLVVSGLRPGTTYTFHVKAISASGKGGPASGTATGTTKKAVMGQAKKPSASAITKSSVTVKTSPVKGADYYRWYLNGSLRGSGDNPIWTFTGLKPGTKYRVNVAADTSTGSPGKQSLTLVFTTKKK